MRSSLKLVVISLCLLLLSGAAFAGKCEDFATYTCAKSAPDQVRFAGLGSGQSVGILLNSNMFTIHDANGSGGADVVIVAASPNGAPSGTLDGIGFTSLSGSFPEKGVTGAITDSLKGLGFCGTTCTLSLGYVDLKTALPTGGSLSVTLSGVANGTVLYAFVLNSQGQIIYVTPNSEAGIVDVSTSVPEPGSLSLLVTGLLGIGGQAWRKLRG